MEIYFHHCMDIEKVLTLLLIDLWIKHIKYVSHAFRKQSKRERKNGSVLLFKSGYEYNLLYLLAA